MFASVLQYRIVQPRDCLASLTAATLDWLPGRPARHFHSRTRFADASYQLLGMILIFLAAALGPSGIGQGKPTHVSLRAPLVLPAPPQGLNNILHFSIFGADDRFNITDTHQFPWSTVALVRTYWSADDLVGKACTGWMIGPSTLVTAAHCIYDHGYPHLVIVKPAMNSDDPNPTPYGTCTVAAAVVPDAWVQKRSMEYDYGVYRLGCSIGKQTGTLGFKATDGDWSQMPVQLTGYPNDKQGRTMWSGVGMVTSSTAKGMYYDVDMWPGQSGSPVWDTEDKDCLQCVVAINSSEFAAPTNNFGARIDLEAFNFLLEETAFDPTRPTASLHPAGLKLQIHPFSPVASNAN